MEVRESLAKQIEKSKKVVTIVFTDIEGSTSFWEKHGDTAGRLMVDLHNKLMFAVVKSYKGTVIKTIGDSIMASFKDPQKAMRAAIAMQKVLWRRKRFEKDLSIKIRIGIHTGKAIIEKNDIFGDVVNVASRVEGLAKGGEIVVSKETVDALGDNRRKFFFEKRDSFVPKGKSQPLDVYRLNWRRHKKLTRNIRTEIFLPVPPRQLMELVVYLLIGLASVYVIFSRFIFYLFADFEFVALYLLNPGPVFTAVCLILLVAGLLAGLVWFLRKVKQVSPVTLKLLKGLFGFGLGFLSIVFLSFVLPGDLGKYWNGSLTESDHLFVEVVRDETSLHSKPSEASRSLATVQAGDIFLQNRLVKKGGRTWTKVLFESDRFGYLPRWTRPAVGVPAYRVTVSDKFYFHYHDLYALLVGLAGFCWGFMTFRIRPL